MNKVILTSVMLLFATISFSAYGDTALVQTKIINHANKAAFQYDVWGQEGALKPNSSVTVHWGGKDDNLEMANPDFYLTVRATPTSGSYNPPCIRFAFTGNYNKPGLVASSIYGCPFTTKTKVLEQSSQNINGHIFHQYVYQLDIYNSAS